MPREIVQTIEIVTGPKGRPLHQNRRLARGTPKPGDLIRVIDENGAASIMSYKKYRETYKNVKWVPAPILSKNRL